MAQRPGWPYARVNLRRSEMRHRKEGKTVLRSCKNNLQQVLKTIFFIVERTIFRDQTREIHPVATSKLSPDACVSRLLYSRLVAESTNKVLPVIIT